MELHNPARILPKEEAGNGVRKYTIVRSLTTFRCYIWKEAIFEHQNWNSKCERFVVLMEGPTHFWYFKCVMQEHLNIHYLLYIYNVQYSNATHITISPPPLNSSSHYLLSPHLLTISHYLLSSSPHSLSLYLTTSSQYMYLLTISSHPSHVNT